MNTPAMQHALDWMSEHGGTGVIDRQGFVGAAGEQSRAFDNATWLRLIAYGYCVGGDGHISVWAEGRAVG